MKRRIKLSLVDSEALTRAIEWKRVRSRADRHEVDEQLRAGSSWLMVALDACYDAQMLLVRPRLWMPLPMDVDPNEVETIIAKGDDGVNGGYQAARLVKNLLAAGLSKYEPEPLKALAAAKAQRTAAPASTEREPEPQPQP